MPKRSSKFRRGKKRGGNCKIGCVTLVLNNTDAVAHSTATPISSTPTKSKCWTKSQLSNRLAASKKMHAGSARKKLAVASAQCKSLATFAQERRKAIFVTKQNCKRRVEEAKRLVEEARSKAGAAVELAILASTAKSERLITSSRKMSYRKIASTTCQVNKRIKISQLEVERLQLECTQQARAAVEQDRMVVTLTRDHATEIDMLKCQHKTALCDMQAKHVLRFEKQKLGMTGEMNRLRELLFGQNEMIDGCLNEMRDEHKAARLALASANQLKIAATGKMEKVKWWKGKCDELKWLNNAYIRQSMKIEEMQLKVNEYEALAENMTEDYEETILSIPSTP